MGIMTLAQARENFLAAMETLRSSKVRTALTVLGIVIGTPRQAHDTRAT